LNPPLAALDGTLDSLIQRVHRAPDMVTKMGVTSLLFKFGDQKVRII
jgi:hypothetical protein